MGEKRVASFLSPVEMFRLDLACKPLREAFDAYGGLYLVGSITTRRDWRDVDVRLILSDKKYDALAKPFGLNALRFLNLAVSAYLRDATGLPVDFQFQRQTEANAKHESSRNPLGSRSLDRFKGDAEPDTDGGTA